MFIYYVYFIIILLICKLGCAFDSTAQTQDVLAFILMFIYSRAVEEPNQLMIANSCHLSTEAKLSQATSILLQSLNKTFFKSI